MVLWSPVLNSGGGFLPWISRHDFIGITAYGQNPLNQLGGLFHRNLTTAVVDDLLLNDADVLREP